MPFYDTGICELEKTLVNINASSNRLLTTCRGIGITSFWESESTHLQIVLFRIGCSLVILLTFPRLMLTTHFLPAALKTAGLGIIGFQP